MAFDIYHSFFSAHGALLVAAMFFVGAAIGCIGKQSKIAENAPVQPHNATLISTPPPPPQHKFKARKGAK